MNLLSVTQNQSSQQDLFSVLGSIYNQKSIRLFQQAQFQANSAPNQTLRDQTLAYYEELQADSGSLLSTYNASGTATNNAPLKDKDLTAMVNEVIGSDLSFTEKKIFIDELLAEYRSTPVASRPSFLDKVHELLADAVQNSDFDGTMTQTQEQLLRLYFAQEASGVDSSQSTSLLDFLG